MTNAQQIGAERTFDDLMIQASVFCEAANLTPEQVAVNSFGYPFIPIPEKRQKGSRIRMAPRNVSSDFLGHPIYWIDSELTDFREGETPEQWSIRMFFVILSLGYIDPETMSWIDVLEVKDFNAFQSSMGESPFIAYHSAGFVQCFADAEEFALMTRSDILKDDNGVSIEGAMNREADKALDMISAIGITDNADYEAKLKASVEMVAIALGGPPEEVSEPSLGGWRLIESQVNAELADYYEAAQDWSVSRVGIQARLISSASLIKATTVGLNVAASTLTMPVIQRMGLSTIESSYLMRFITEQSTATVISDELQYADHLTKAFESISYEEVENIFKRIYSDYQQAWKRARMAFLNFSIQDDVAAGKRDFFISYDDVADFYDVDRDNSRYTETLSYVETSSPAQSLDEFFTDEQPREREYSPEITHRPDNDADDLNSILDELDDYSHNSRKEVGKYEIELD